MGHNYINSPKFLPWGKLKQCISHTYFHLISKSKKKKKNLLLTKCQTAPVGLNQMQSLKPLHTHAYILIIIIIINESLSHPSGVNYMSYHLSINHISSYVFANYTIHHLFQLKSLVSSPPSLIPWTCNRCSSLMPRTFQTTLLDILFYSSYLIYTHS